MWTVDCRSLELCPTLRHPLDRSSDSFASTKKKTIISKDFYDYILFINSLFIVISLEAENIYNDVDITQFPPVVSDYARTKNTWCAVGGHHTSSTTPHMWVWSDRWSHKLRRLGVPPAFPMFIVRRVAIITCWYFVGSSEI